MLFPVPLPFVFISSETFSELLLTLSPIERIPVKFFSGRLLVIKFKHESRK